MDVLVEEWNGERERVSGGKCGLGPLDYLQRDSG